MTTVVEPDELTALHGGQLHQEVYHSLQGVLAPSQAGVGQQQGQAVQNLNKKKQSQDKEDLFKY